MSDAPWIDGPNYRCPHDDGHDEILRQQIADLKQKVVNEVKHSERIQKYLDDSVRGGILVKAGLIGNIITLLVGGFSGQFVPLVCLVISTACLVISLRRV
jgi:hypothetical protein